MRRQCTNHSLRLSKKALFSQLGLYLRFRFLQFRPQVFDQGLCLLPIRSGLQLLERGFYVREQSVQLILLFISHGRSHCLMRPFPYA